MQAELAQYQRGDLTFDEFARATHKTWVAFSVHLLGRWKASPAVAPEDLQQELLVACWRCVPKWDPARSALLKFVVYNCMDKAKKWLHKQRNAYRRDDKSPGRFPVALTSLGLEPYQEEKLLEIVSVAPLQEERIERVEALASVESDDLAFMFYQQKGSIEAAARAICASKYAKIVLQAVSLDTAMAVVEHSIERMSQDERFEINRVARFTNGEPVIWSVLERFTQNQRAATAVATAAA